MLSRMAVRKRKLVRWCAVILFAVLLVIVAMPLWFPWTARRIARAFGANYSNYQREGYGRFRLDNVTFTNDDGAFRAKQVDAYVPTAWLWRLLWHSKQEPFVQAHSWEYFSFPSTNK